jgi:hypothetical protein
VIASVLKLAEPVAGSGETCPMRRGRIGAKKLMSEPVVSPWYTPAPAITSSLNSVSDPTRIRCCRSAISGCTCAMPWAGFIRLKIAPVTVIMIAAEISSSTSV